MRLPPRLRVLWLLVALAIVGVLALLGHVASSGRAASPYPDPKRPGLEQPAQRSSPTPSR